MTKGRPLPIILKFLIPLMMGNIFQQLYNMADTIIVGRFVSEEALAAVGSTGSIMFLVLGFAQGLTTGFTVLTSQCYGAGNNSRVKRSVANGILLSLIVSVVITLISVSLMRPLLKLMNTPENIFPDALRYISIICGGLVTSVFYNLFSSYLRSVGNSRIPLYFLMFSAGLNVILDLAFIILFHMGVAGAAYATVLSQGISAVLCLIYIRTRVPVLWPGESDWKLNRPDTHRQMVIGVPMALQFAITASGTMIMQAAINLFGSTAVAAYTAASKLQSLLIQGMPAMGQAMATYCGQNYGKRDSDRIRQGVRAAIIVDTVYAAVAALLVAVLYRPMLGLFFAGDVSIEELIPWARTYLYICLVFYIPLSYIFVFRNAMQGCGYGFLPMMGGVVELGARLLVAVIAMRLYSYTLAATCDPAAWVAAALFTGISYRFVIRRIVRELKPAETPAETAAGH